MILIRLSRRSRQKEGKSHAASHDDGRYDGRRCDGPDGVKNNHDDGRQSPVAEQNRSGPVRHHCAQETFPTATRRS